MTRLIAVSISVVLLAALLPTPHVPATVWADGPTWVDDGSGSWTTSDNSYVMTGKLQDAGRYTHWDQELCDFTFQADVQKTQGDCAEYGWGYGLYFRSDGTQEDYYEFIINVDGLYQIGESIDGQFSKLVNWTASDALRSGYDQWNTLKVVGKGADLYFYANDVLAATITDESIPCGKLGLFAIDGEESDVPDVVHFANIQLWPEAVIPPAELTEREPALQDTEPPPSPAPALVPTVAAPVSDPGADEDAEMLDFEPVEETLPATPPTTSMPPAGPGVDEDAEMLDFEPVEEPSPASPAATPVPAAAGRDSDEDAEMLDFQPLQDSNAVPPEATSVIPAVPGAGDDAEMLEAELPTEIMAEIAAKTESTTAPVQSATEPPATALVVAAEGGQVSLPDGASIAIPPGALDIDARVSVASLGRVSPSDDPEVKLGSEAYRFTVEGQDLFWEPVVVTVPYREADIPVGTSESDTGIAYYDEIIGEWLLETEGISVDTARNLVSVITFHASDWRPSWCRTSGRTTCGRQGVGWMQIYSGAALPPDYRNLPEDTKHSPVRNRITFTVGRCEAGPPLRCTNVGGLWTFGTIRGKEEDVPRVAARGKFGRNGECVSDGGGQLECSGGSFVVDQRLWPRPSAGGEMTRSGLACEWDATVDGSGKVSGHLTECEETDKDGNVTGRIEPDPSGLFEVNLRRAPYHEFVLPATPTPELSLWLGGFQRFYGKPCVTVGRSAYSMCGEAQGLTIDVLRDKGYASGLWQYQDSAANPTCKGQFDFTGTFDEDRTPVMMGSATGGLSGSGCGAVAGWTQEWGWEGELTESEDCMLRVTLFDAQQGRKEIGEICLRPE